MFVRSSTNSEGRFAAVSIPPGDYRAFALTNLPNGLDIRSLFFLSKYQNLAKPLHVDTGSTVEIGLRMIKAAELNDE